MLATVNRDIYEDDITSFNIIDRGTDLIGTEISSLMFWKYDS